MKINFWVMLGKIGGIVEDITTALENDGKVDALEVIGIASHLMDELDITLDEDNQKYMDVVIDIIQWLQFAAEDGKISVTEVVELFDEVAETLGFDFDKEGLNFKI